jgi:ABC-type transport system substrate-binding protein
MKHTRIVATLALLLILAPATFLTPAFGWIYPNDTEDERFESFGPRADQLWIELYSKVDSEFCALENGEIDFANTHFNDYWANRLSQPPNNEHIRPVFSGLTRKMFGININTNNNQFLGDPPDHEYENLVYPNPCSVPAFRHALAHLMDRDEVTSYWTGFAYPAYTLVPPSMPEYVHPDICPGGSLQSLCHPYNVAEANNILNTYDGDDNTTPDFPIGPDGWRFWDLNGNGNEDLGEEIFLNFIVDITDIRMKDAAEWYWWQLRDVSIETGLNFTECVLGPIGTKPSMAPPGIVYQSKLYGATAYKDFHLCLVSWDLGPTPEHLAMFNSSNYWHPHSCPNYGAFDCQKYDEYVEDLIFASTTAEAQSAAYEAQRVFANETLGGIGCIPIGGYTGDKAMQRRYAGGTDQEDKYEGSYWRGIVNSPSRGPDNWWSFLNMYPDSHLVGDGPMTIRWGYLGPCDRLNPLFPSSSLDCEVLSLVYDSLLKQDPYTGEWIPWMCERFETGLWKDPNTQEFKTKVTFTIRNDIYWHDGTPFTVADVAYTLCELPKLLSWLPTWSGNPLWVRSFKVIDAVNIEILFEVSSVWIPFWIGTNIILPKHVWKPMVDSYLSEGEPDIVFGPLPDPDLIGTGPWRFVDYEPAIFRVDLVANKPGVVVHGITGPGYWQLYPVRVSVAADDSRVRFDPGYPSTEMLVNFRVDLLSLWFNQSSGGTLTVSRYVYLDNDLIAEDHGILLLSNSSEEQFFQRSLAKCKHEVKVAVHIDGPPWVDALHLNPWICQWINVTIPIWITIKQDVGGAMYQGKVPAPDCKVDGKDIAYASEALYTVPGDKKWSPVADVTGNYKIDGKDVANIAKFYGKW